MTEEEKELAAIREILHTCRDDNGYIDLEISAKKIAAGYTKQPAEKLVSLDENEVYHEWCEDYGKVSPEQARVIKWVCNKFGTPPPTEMVINEDQIRTFKAFLWNEMHIDVSTPGAEKIIEYTLSLKSTLDVERVFQIIKLAYFDIKGKIVDHDNFCRNLAEQICAEQALAKAKQ